jgi:NAD(P)H-dependent FMN reductase
MRILGFGGSLRSGSWNRALLDEAAHMMPGGAELDLGHLDIAGSLPLYNQDLDSTDEAPPGVLRLKEALRGADGLLVATPEYNWGIPGFLKNAIDWVSRPASDIPAVFGDLPAAVIGAGGLSGTRNAQAAWMAVFRYLKMRPWLGDTLFVDRIWERFDYDNHVIDEATRERLQKLISGFADYCERLPRSRDR